MVNEIAKLPTIDELYSQSELPSLNQQNQLNLLLNQPPKKSWLKQHPIATKKVDGKTVPIDYLPIERVEWMLTNIFINWSVEIKETKLLANSILTIVRLHYKNPITGLMEWQDGQGAAPCQTDSGKGAADWNFIKANAVQIAAPAAESYAVKDAAEKIGKIFGKDLNRADEISYNNLSDKLHEVTKEELGQLLLEKETLLTAEELSNAGRIINCEEKESYNKLFKILKSKL